jgi:two-component system CheB/CheR fusion protein
MAFMETADAYPRPRGLQVFATDVNEESLTKARRGFYTKNMVHDVSPARLKRFFVEVDGGYQVIKPLREILVFARQNALRDPPFSRMDLISCRNLMIYLVTDPQRRLLPNFHYALKPGGSLLLGSSESVGQFTDLFAPVDRKNKIFSKRVAQNPTFNLAGPNGGDRRPRADRAPNSQARRAYNASEGLYGGQNPEREADRLMLLRFSPPGVVVNESLQILQFRGPTGEFLEPQSGKASFDLLRMVREGLMLPLRAALNFAKKNHQAVRTKAVRIKGGGADRDVMMEVIPIKNLKEPCFMVLFISHDPGGNGNHGGHPPAAARDTPPIESAPGGDGGSHLVVSLERELSETRDYLHSVQEDQEMANEELQASNEEGQSVNEELQSLNEELETSKEELESTNEELMTVNEDMVHRNSELQQLNNDLRNIETSTHLAIVLLTCDLKIRHFSTEAEMILRLNAEDIGAPIGSSCQGLPLPDVATVAMECISRRLPAERELQDKAGSWYLLRVRPSLAADGTVDGAVLVLIDINHLKATEKLITEARQHAEAIIRTVPSPMLILGPDLRIRSANDAFSRAFKTSPKEFVGKPFFEIGRGEWNFAGLQRLLDDVIHNDGFFDSFEVARSFKRVGHRSLELFGRVLVESSERPRSVLLGIRDVTSARLAELELARARALLVDHAESLEQTVVERTKELTKANEHLLLSIDAIKKGKDSYRVLLARSEDMQHQLRQITRRIIAVQEEERKQISRELHDDVIQSLIGISFEISCILKDAPGDPERVRERIEGTQKTVQRSVEAVHRFARGLRPALLDDIGLVAALHSYCNSLAAREKIEIEVDASGEFAGLNGEKRTVLFRVAQEALTNVVRHAQASKALVSIHPGTDTVLMVVSDNGRSFNIEDATGAKSTRLGLVGMKERVDMVGGTLLIESTPGKGTSVQIEIPLSSSPPIPTPKQ